MKINIPRHVATMFRAWYGQDGGDGKLQPMVDK